MPKRKSTKKRGRTSVKSLNQRVKKLERLPEWKYADEYVSLIDINTTGVVTFLNGVAQSAGASTHDTRIGDNIQCRKIKMRGYFHNNQGTPEDCIIRLMFFKSKDVSNTQPGTGQILVNQDVISMRAFEELYNVKVDYDETFSMDTLQHTIIPFKYIKKANFKTTFDGPTAAIASCEQNGYFMLCMSNIVGATNCPQLTIRWRTYFTDS